MKLNKAREMLLDMYINSLQEEKLFWNRGWEIDLYQEQHNPVSKIVYKGVNSLLLNAISDVRKYTDPRWLTFKQIQDNGYKLENGKGQGVPIEFWSVYDKTQKKTISISEYNQAILQDPNNIGNYSIVDRTYYVFNAKHIEGLPTLDKEIDNSKLENHTSFIENLIQNMQVGYEERGNKAFYNPTEDKVVIPKRNQFISQYEYDSTRLHELCHATGHHTRLNRKTATSFGTPEYAIEELRAEITASFLAQDVHIKSSQAHLDNHKAYIQDWIKILKNNSNELFKAIKDAEKIYDYVVEKGELHKFIEKEQQDLPQLPLTIEDKIKAFENMSLSDLKAKAIKQAKPKTPDHTFKQCKNQGIER